jgi:oxygen-independent coproporphyrinogen-3 oxidase
VNAGVYIHVPFCRRKCDYCSFFSVQVDPASENAPGGLFERYTNRVLSEIEQRARETAAYSFDTIYFGGGTHRFSPGTHGPDHSGGEVGLRRRGL